VYAHTNFDYFIQQSTYKRSTTSGCNDIRTSQIFLRAPIKQKKDLSENAAASHKYNDVKMFLKGFTTHEKYKKFKRYSVKVLIYFLCKNDLFGWFLPYIFT